MRIGGIPEPFNFAWKLAIERGLLKGVTWSDWPGGSGAVCEAIHKADLDAGIVLTEAAVWYPNQNEAFTVVMPFTLSPLHWGIYAPSVAQPKDFFASKIAVSRLGSGSHLMVRVYAGQKGRDPKNMIFLPKGSFYAMYEAVMSGEADFFLWEKWYTRSFAGFGDLEEIDDFAAEWPSFVAVARQGFVAQLEAAVKVVMDLISSLQVSGQLESVIIERFGFSSAAAKAWLGENRWNLAGEALQLSYLEAIKKIFGNFP